MPEIFEIATTVVAVAAIMTVCYQIEVIGSWKERALEAEQQLDHALEANADLADTVEEVEQELRETRAINRRAAIERVMADPLPGARPVLRLAG